jgi:hypothetical protein
MVTSMMIAFNISTVTITIQEWSRGLLTILGLRKTRNRQVEIRTSMIHRERHHYFSCTW